MRVKSQEPVVDCPAMFDCQTRKRALVFWMVIFPWFQKGTHSHLVLFFMSCFSYIGMSISWPSSMVFGQMRVGIIQKISRRHGVGISKFHRLFLVDDILYIYIQIIPHTNTTATPCVLPGSWNWVADVCSSWISVYANNLFSILFREGGRFWFLVKISWSWQPTQRLVQRGGGFWSLMKISHGSVVHTRVCGLCLGSTRGLWVVLGKPPITSTWPI